MKKRLEKLALLSMCVITLVACGSKKNINENKDPLTGEEMSKNEEVENQESTEMASSVEYLGTHGYDNMLGNASDPSEIIDYINTNAANATESDIDYFFRGLLDFGDDVRNIDFTKLEGTRQYMPEDMIAFYELMRLEADTPSMAMSDKDNRKIINMTLSEMLERALLFEQHIEKYPDNTSTKAAKRIYEEIATNAISGGYDKTNGIEHFYKGDSADVVDEDSLQYYQQFVKANPDSRLGKIVSEYTALLQKNKFKIDDEVEEFYMSLHQKLNDAI